jgi:myo-inositol 2-dehydrogenase/D-chiro-inositol 1-dehydrogenase
MRIAVLGVGRMGALHATILSEHPRVSRLVLADADRGRASALAAQLEAEARDPADALRGADAVIIATPPEHHATAVEAAVDAGVPALCEKPLAADLEETIRLTERVEDAGAVLQVGFQRRFDPGYAEARRLVASGELGRVHLLRLAAHDPLVARDPASDLFRDSSIHDFDLLRWLTGAEVEMVYADGADRGPAAFDRRANPDTAAAIMRLSSGALATFGATRLNPLGYDVRTELLGSRDSVVVGLGPRTPQRSLDAEHGWWPLEGAWNDYLVRFEPAYRAELDAFLAVAAGERPSPVTARDGLEAMRIAVAATASVREQRAVGLAEIPTARTAAVAA